MSDREHGNAGYLMSETAYFISRNVRMLFAKFNTTVLNGGIRKTHGVGGAFGAIGNWFENNFGSTVGKIIGSGALVGVVAMISAAMAQLDYRHLIDNIKKFYKDELSTKLEKQVKNLDEKDIYKIVQGDAAEGIRANRTFAEHVGKLRANRTATVIISTAASLLAFGAVAAAIHFIPPFAAAIHALTLTTPGIPAILAEFPSLMAEAAVGLGIYNVAKLPMHWVAHKMFNLDFETTHERITQMQRDHNDGKIITRERLLEVFASANPDLSKQEISQRVSLDALADGINKGTYKVTELAFAVHGQTSAPDDTLRKPQGFIRKCYNGMCRVFHIVPGASVQPIPAMPVAAPIEYNNPTSARPFVERLGLSKANTSLGYVERLEKQSQEIALNAQR